ncbi:MAG TPA: GIY-YIG nuclease family protein [Methylovirgula sp.]|nr:GIY-YIG nuclease family protein [Methylovirgula sp.]
MPAAYFYILASERNGTLYCGSTAGLANRVFEHKGHLRPGFTSRYGVTRLVYYEAYDRLMDARSREYKVKKWRRAWKLALIESMNPQWLDLYESLAN